MQPLTHATSNSAQELRQRIRQGNWRSPTAGQAAGFVQANLVILPLRLAADFEQFCKLNPRPCPLIEVTSPGDPCPRQSAPEADLRRDVPRYRVFRGGVLDAVEPTQITELWRDDFVGFLLGCSFTFENSLIRAGLPVRHIDEGRNVPMFITNLPCHAAGPFAGPMVVSMRPFPKNLVDQVIDITAKFPKMHGGPIHWGAPGQIGIRDLSCPDFGDAVTVQPDEVPMFWACGVTPQLAILSARPEIAITHSPGFMFVTNLRDSDFFVPGATRESYPLPGMTAR